MLKLHVGYRCKLQHPAGYTFCFLFCSLLFEYMVDCFLPAPRQLHGWLLWFPGMSEQSQTFPNCWHQTVAWHVWPCPSEQGLLLLSGLYTATLLFGQAGSHCVALADLELTVDPADLVLEILLSSQCWDYTCTPPCPVNCYFLQAIVKRWQSAFLIFLPFPPWSNMFSFRWVLLFFTFPNVREGLFPSLHLHSHSQTFPLGF